MKKIELGFTQKITLLHFVAMFIMVTFSALYFQFSVKNQFENSEIKKASQIAENIAINTPAFIELGLNDEIKNELNNTFSRNPGVISVEITDINYKLITKLEIEKTEDFFVITQTIYSSLQHKAIGYVKLNYSKSEYKKAVAKQLEILFVLLFLAFCFSIISSIFLKRQLAPLRNLANQLEDQSIQTNLKSIQRIQGNDELSVIQNKICDSFEIAAKYQLEIEEINRNLENLVHTRTAKLQEALNDLKQKDDMLIIQSRFSAMGEMMANIAHQWRQPLNIIKSSISLLSFHAKLGKAETESIIKTGAHVESQIDYLSQTIEDFRDFYKDDTADTFSIADAITKTMDLISASYASHFIKIEFINNSNRTIFGSQSRLTQVILNLLNNAKDAILETKVKGVVIITLETQDNITTISVQDNAKGVSESVIPKIFEPYFTTKHKSQGTGLGLYMSRQIIERHFNSQITAQNQSFSYGNADYFGAKFIITFANKPNQSEKI